MYQWYVERAGTSKGFHLFERLLRYDPEQRISASDALSHSWFHEDPLPKRT